MTPSPKATRFLTLAFASAALAVAGGAPSKVSMDVPCRRSCMLCLDRDGKSTCAVAVIALELVGRA